MTLTPASSDSITCKVKLWRSGIFWSVLSFVSGLGNLACSSVIARNLKPTNGEFGASSSALDFVTFLGLPLSMLNMSVVHYIAHFRSKNDEARLQGLLAGCQKLLLWATAGGSLLALALWQPLGRFFDFQSTSLRVAVLVCGMIGWWSGFPYWITVAVCIVGGVLGVMYSVPLRRALVTGSDLPYPEGVAAAEVLEVGEVAVDGCEGNRRSLRAIIVGSLAAAGF